MRCWQIIDKGSILKFRYGLKHQMRFHMKTMMAYEEIKDSGYRALCT
jgi:hypothetical protein